MKKLFMFMCVALFAATATLLTSCGGDDEKETPIAEKVYDLEVGLPQDVMDIMDVTIIRTAGNDVKELPLTTKKTFVSHTMFADISFEGIGGSDQFRSADGFSVKCKATLKSNYKEILKTKTKFVYGYYRSSNGSTEGWTKTIGSKFEESIESDEYVRIASELEELLTFEKK